ncbi:MAG: hypothetical protein WC211_03600 [Dehalococcoidia bacterium]
MDQDRPQDENESAGEQPQDVVAPASAIDPEDLLAQAFEEMSEPAGDVDGDVPDEDEDPDEDSAVDDDQDDDADTGDEPPAEDEDAEPETPEQRMLRHTIEVAKNPAAINSVPRRLLADVTKNLLGAAYKRGHDDAQEKTSAQASEEEQLRTFVAETERVRETDPDAFSAWEEAEPEQAAAFWQGRAYFKKKATPVNPAAAIDPVQFKADTDHQLSRVRAIPEQSRNALIARINAGEFTADRTGLANLTKAIDDAFVASVAKPVPADVRERAERRDASVKKRAGLARVPSTGGNAPSTANPIRDINDPEELFARAFAE